MMIEQGNDPGRQTKKLHIEIMRIIAILFVIYNHTGDYGFMLFRFYPNTDIRYWVFLMISVFCPFAVPLFFAISGALLIPKEEPIKTIWMKRIVKMGIILLVASFIGYVKNFVPEQGFSLKHFIKLVYSSPDCWFALWFLYSYIAFLIGLPFLRCMVKNMPDKLFYYLIAITITCDAIPILEYLLFKQRFTLYGIKPEWLIASIVRYPAVGYFMEHREGAKTMENKLPVLWCVNIASLALCTVTTTVKLEDVGIVPVISSMTFFRNCSLISCISIFLTVKHITKRITFSRRAEKLIMSMGKCTIGVYLLHTLIKNAPFSVAFEEAILALGLPPMIAVWIFIFYVFVVCYLITLILQKIPLIKKLVGG